MKKILSCLFATTMLFTCAACSTNPDATGNSGGMGDQAAKYLTQIKVNSYENSSEFDSCYIGNRLGKVNTNTDKTYVKSGNQSAKITVTGDARYKNPYLYQTFDLQKKSDSRDFSKVILMTMWIYNANDTDKTCDLTLSFTEGSMGSKTYSLKANSWTHVRHYITRENLPVNNCEGYYLYFNKSLETPDVFYMDDVVLYKTDKLVERQEISLSENEICSYDKLYQHSFLTVATDSCFNNDLLPNLSISQEYTWRNGDFNLKVEVPRGTDKWQEGSQNWPGVEIHQSLIQLIDWTKYDDNDVFSFDYYVPEENGLDFLWLSFYNVLEERYFVSDSFSLKKGSWQTVRFTVGELNSQYQDKDFTFATTYRLVLRWGEFNDGEDRLIYLDNFKMEVN